LESLVDFLRIDRDLLAEHASKRSRAEAARRAKEKARHDREAAIAREKHLDSLAGRESKLWGEVDAFVASKQPKSVHFDLATLTVGLIREDQEYGGVRAEVVARVTNAQVRLQVDVGFGDAVTPDALVVELPPLLDFPAPRLRVRPSSPRSSRPW
jgi:sRNA-binding protein